VVKAFEKILKEPAPPGTDPVNPPLFRRSTERGEILNRQLAAMEPEEREMLIAEILEGIERFKNAPFNPAEELARGMQIIKESRKVHKRILASMDALLQVVDRLLEAREPEKSNDSVPPQSQD